jgi:hypothetical protein
MLPCLCGHLQAHMGHRRNSSTAAAVLAPIPKSCSRAAPRTSVQNHPANEHASLSKKAREPGPCTHVQQRIRQICAQTPPCCAPSCVYLVLPSCKTSHHVQHLGGSQQHTAPARAGCGKHHEPGLQHSMQMQRQSCNPAGLRL